MDRTFVMLQSLSARVPFLVVAIAMAFSVILFTLAATLSKHAADECSKLPAGDGVLAKTVRVSLKSSIEARYRRLMWFFALWTTLAGLASVCGVVAFRALDTTTTLPLLTAAMALIPASIAAAVSGMKAHFRTRANWRSLTGEIETAKNAKRERGLVSASLAELESFHQTHGAEEIHVRHI